MNDNPLYDVIGDYRADTVSEIKELQTKIRNLSKVQARGQGDSVNNHLQIREWSLKIEALKDQLRLVNLIG